MQQDKRGRSSKSSDDSQRDQYYGIAKLESEKGSKEGKLKQGRKIIGRVKFNIPDSTRRRDEKMKDIFK